MDAEGSPLSSRLFGYFSISEECVRIRKKVDLYRIAGKVTIFSHTPCRSLEDVLSLNSEIGSFCLQAATKTFDFVVFFLETRRLETRKGDERNGSRIGEMVQ